MVYGISGLAGEILAFKAPAKRRFDEPILLNGAHDIRLILTIQISYCELYTSVVGGGSHGMVNGKKCGKFGVGPESAFARDIF